MKMLRQGIIEYDYDTKYNSPPKTLTRNMACEQFYCIKQ